MKSEDETANLVPPKETDEKERLSVCCMFPKSVYFILSNEFCERFNFYGFKAVLLLYFTNHILIESHRATALYHAFTFLAYFTPILGGILADSIIGKYWTILSLSVVYVIGSAILTFTAMAPPNLVGPLIGLILIGFGTGGIKPCVSTFGADQFPPSNKRMIDSFFSLFYWCINLGAFSSFFTPILRSGVTCFNDDCYSLAFGLPLIVMVGAVIVFVLGTPLYVRKPLLENVLLKMIRCLTHAIKNWYNRRKTDPQPELLDYALDKYTEIFIEDIRSALRVLVIFIPFPIFWALFEQMNSRWLLQAAQMDGRIAGTMILLPEQIAALNTIFVILFVPIFDVIVFPLIAKCKLNFTHLRRIGTGIFFAGMAFLAAFFLQLHLEAIHPKSVESNNARIQILSLDTCNVSATSGNYTWTPPATVPSFSVPVDVKLFELGKGSKTNMSYSLPINLEVSSCAAIGLNDTLKTTTSVNVLPGNTYTLVTYLDRTTRTLTSNLILNANKITKIGKTQIRALARKDPLLTGATLKLATRSSSATDVSFILSQSESGNSVDFWITSYVTGSRSLYDARMTLTNGKMVNLGLLNIRINEITTLFVYPASSNVSLTPWKLSRLVEVKGSTTSLLWQVPQYMILTIGEVLFSISALAFVYLESPETMRSIMTSFYLLCVAIGNLIIVLAAESQMLDQLSHQFILFFIICMITVLLFVFLAIRFRHRVKPEDNNPNEMEGKDEATDET